MDINISGFGTMYDYPPDSPKIKGTISDSLTDIDEILMGVDDVCKRIRGQDISDTAVKNIHRRTKADVERDFYK